MLAVLAAMPARAQPAPTLDQYLCLRGAASRHADRALRFTPHDELSVRDRLIAAASAASAQVDLRKAAGLCVPTAAPGTPLVDAATHLELYDARFSRTRPPQPRIVPGVQHVTNALGSEDLRVQQIEEVLIPSSAVFDPPPAPASVPADVDDFTCYAADRLRAAQVKPIRRELATGIGTLQIDVRAPVRLCVPADIEAADPSVPSHPAALACYRATLGRSRPRQASPFPLDVATANRFGTEQLTLTATFELCVPSTLDGSGPAPTPTPTATTVAPTPSPSPTAIANFTLRINPAATTVDIGESAHFTATADFENGDHADFTERVVWSSSSDAAVAPNVAGDRGRIDAVDGGQTVISVLDEATGVSSTTTGGDAQLTVNWTLERIELTPLASTRGVGESIRLRATGHFKGGFTRLVTQEVVFASSAQSIALATNAATEADHSRIVAVGAGTATLSASDPVSGVTSTASNDDVALTVVPALARCTILQTGPITIGITHDYQLTAHGFYPGGFERNLTQQVVWSSDAPAIVEAPNTDGDRSRLHMLGPGTAHVTAKDSITGLACENGVTFEVGIPTGFGIFFSAGWDSGHPRRVGDSWHVRALQRFFTFDDKYVTQKVHFDSNDPTIAAAPNVDGDRGRIDAVSGGTAQITATDPADGATSNSLPVRVLDGLTRVEVSFPRRPIGKPLIVPRSFATHLEATGHFGDGTAPLEAKDVTFVSDNPTAVEVLEGGGIFRWSFRAVGDGNATISAIDDRTGISSDVSGDSVRVAVRGPLQSLEIVPSRVTRRVGDDFSFAVVGHFEGGVTDVVTQDVNLASSDPPIVEWIPYFPSRANVHAVAGGEAVITAVDPGTGISSADTGSTATMTVVGPLQRLRVTPTDVSRSVGRSFQFTAIGSDAADREINLTQDVTWSSSDPAVAVAANVTGDQSRVDMVAEGTATISAFDPQDSVSSTTTGDDATLTVSGILASLTLAAEHTELFVGGAVALTATGHLVGGDTVNLTQQVVYGSSNPGVVRADNAPGNRSSVTALAPGTAVISAHDPGTGIDTAPNATVTLTVVAP